MSQAATALTRFSPDQDPAAISAALERDGAVVLEGLVDSASLDQIARDLAPWLDLPVDRSPLHNNSFTGKQTLRTSSLVAKSDACGQLVMDPTVLGLVERVLGPQCDRFQLSFTQAIKIGPGEKPQAIHRDTSMYPFKRPGPEVFINAIWALTDFSRENGGTRFLLGSHRWPEERLPSREDAVVSAEMARGSVVIYYGSVFHGGGGNQTDGARVGIAFGYTLGWLRQEENQYLAVPPARARQLPIELQRMIGYAEHYPFLGWHEGQDDEVAHGGPQRKDYATEVVGGSSVKIAHMLETGKI